MNDERYTSNLAEFVCKTISRWGADKKKLLEDKLRRNFEAVTNQDFREKKWKKDEGTSWRSDTWIGFVRVKVWALFSMLTDTVLRAGKLPFVLQPSKYDEKYMTPYQLKERDARLEKMTAKIEWQLDARKARPEYQKKWLSYGYYGMAFSRFDLEDVENVEFRITLPPEVEQAVDQGLVPPEAVQQYARYEMIKESETVPGHRYVSVWDMIWDMDGDSLQTNEGYAQHKVSSPYELRKLEGPGYIKDAIERAIEENKNKKDSTGKPDVAESPGKAALTDRKKTIDRYEFYMRVPQEYAAAFEKDLMAGGQGIASLSTWDQQEHEESGFDVEIMGEIAGKEIIRYIRNQTGKRPHKMSVVEMNLDETTGTGIADNMEGVQAALIGMVRAFEDNKKLSANVIMGVKARFFANPEQAKEMKPGTQIEVTDACTDVRQAMMPVVIPDVGESLMSAIQLMLQLKDDVSMVPTILQGFTLPKHKPDTAFELNQLTQNAGKYIGQIIRNNDEQFIEPEIQEIYEYNMLYGKDEECKVNCKVKANGFTSFQNKEIRGARMQQALTLLVSSELLAPWIKIEPHLEIIYEAMDEDPSRFIKSEDERAKDSQAMQQSQVQMQAQAIQVAMAQLGAEAKKEIAVKEKEHEHRMLEEDQEHEHRLIEDGVKAKIAVKNKPKESMKGSEV